MTLDGKLEGTLNWETGCSDISIIGDLVIEPGVVLTEVRNITVAPGVKVTLDGTVNFSGTWTVGAGSTVSGAGSAQRMAFPTLSACASPTGAVGQVFPVLAPVPALDGLALASLSAALGALGWRASRRRRQSIRPR